MWQMVEMQRYAKWKATDIAQALREGRQPAAGSLAEPVDAALGSSDSGIPDLETLLPLPPKSFASKEAKATETPAAPGYAQAGKADLFPQLKQEQEKKLQQVQQQQEQQQQQQLKQQHEQQLQLQMKQQQEQQQLLEQRQQQQQLQQQLQWQQQQLAAQQREMNLQRQLPTPSTVAAPSAAQENSYSQSQVSEVQQMEAQKYTKYALSALQFDDIPTATKNLRLALEALSGSQKSHV